MTSDKHNPGGTAPGVSNETESQQLLGCVALVDALGFKAFRKRHPNPEVVLRTLEAIRNTYLEQAGNYMDIARQLRAIGLGDKWNPVFRAFFMSDTVAFLAGVPKDESNDALQASIVGLLAGSIAHAIRRAAEPGIALLYRGAIAVGDLAVSNSFAIGNAVDEAANVMEAADAAVVWLTPSALRIVEDERSAFHLTGAGSLLNCVVPLKSGRTFETKAVNPFYQYLMGDSSQLRTRILAAFGSDVDFDVAIKRQHTDRFLNAALRAERERRQANDQARKKRTKEKETQ